MSSMWGSMRFPLGFVEEISVSTNVVDVTAFGDSSPRYLEGSVDARMTLRLYGPDAVGAVLAALGATESQVQRVLSDAVGRRDVELS